MNKDRLRKHCKTFLLDAVIKKDYMKFDGKEYFIVPGDVSLFDEEFNFIGLVEGNIISEMREEYDGFVYEFGGRWYLQEGDNFELDDFRYKGKAKQKIPTENFLGVHSGYEVLNGVGEIKNWVKKADFLGIKNLGYCEKNSLASVLIFQKECLKKKINPVVGCSLSVRDEDYYYELKLYVKDYTGWSNLLKLTTLINLEQQSAVDIKVVKKNLEGLFAVLDPKSIKYEKIPDFISFYQLDPIQYREEEQDREYLNNLEKFILDPLLDPVSITDSYVMEKEDIEVRELMWIVAGAFDDQAENQYFKNKDQYAEELINLFEKSNNSWVSLYKKAVLNESYIVENCNFQYDTDSRHLPKYTMTEEEKLRFGDNPTMFLELVKEGFYAKGIKDTQKYIDRLKEEIRVLKKGDVLDYFLSLYDIVKYAKSQGILTGIGRGSAGGSLVSYFLGIIHIDPLQFDLLFERFLNDGRMGHFETRPSFSIETEEGTIELSEGSVLKIQRGTQSKIILVNELEEGDQILKYEE